MAEISKNNYIIIYNIDSPDSLSFAEYYAQNYEMKITSDNPSVNFGSIGGISWEVMGQMVGIECSNQEILLSENDFNNKVLNPIKDAISNSEELQSMEIMGIIIGYMVPGGFVDGENIISSQSRLSRINFSFSEKTNNKLYNRSIFKRFDTEDSNSVIICSRIDAHSLQAAKSVVDNGSVVSKRLFVDGTFYIDPYSDIHAYYSTEYTDNILEFYNGLLGSLNLDVFTTEFLDPYIDSAIPYVVNDSFVWSWFSDRGRNSFFQFSNAVRVFFYNADYDGAYSVREENNYRWVYLSLNNGYASTAGSMSNPGIDGFLNPFAFINTLFRGGTIGEAFLYSCPYVDWTVGLFGDPMVSCSFPSSPPSDENVTNEHTAWEEMSIYLAMSAANLYKKDLELKEIRNDIVNLTSEDMSVELDLLYPINNLSNSVKYESRKSQLQNLVNSLFDFPTNRYYFQSDESLSPSINTYLDDNNFRVSRLLSEIYSSSVIDESNLYDEGWWRIDFELTDDLVEYVEYHFIINVYEQENDIGNDSNILLSVDSSDIRNWKYEVSKDHFEVMSFEGVSSSYVGRRIRYESRFDSLSGINQYLERGKTYYFEVIQYNTNNGEHTSNRSIEQIIYT